MFLFNLFSSNQKTSIEMRALFHLDDFKINMTYSNHVLIIIDFSPKNHILSQKTSSTFM